MCLYAVFKGLPSAPSLWGNPHPGRWGPTHHPEGPKPSPAAVGPAGLRVRGACAGCQPPCHGAALQQHQRAVPEQLGMTSNTPSGSLTAVKWGRRLVCCVGKVHRVHLWILPEVLTILRRKSRKVRVMRKDGKAFERKEKSDREGRKEKERKRTGKWLNVCRRNHDFNTTVSGKRDIVRLTSRCSHHRASMWSSTGLE